MINRKYLKLISIALILIISIGFAYLTSSLIINGVIGYKGNSWNIYFDNISMIRNDVGGAKPTINNNKDTVNFSITFSEPGETFKFSVDVVNKGTIDAMLSEILTTGINSSNSSYLSYTVKYYDDTELSLNDGIKAGTKTRLNVEVNYKYDTEVLAPEGNQDFSIKLTYVQAGDNATFKNTLINPDNNNVFTLNNAKSNSLNNLKIYGNSKQNTYTGRNLYNVNDFKTGSGSADSDGWITISYNNSGGDGHIYAFYCTHDLDLIVGHEYTIVAEIKSVSGTGAFRPFSTYDNVGQFAGPSNDFSALSNNSIRVYKATVRDEVNGDQGLRTHVDFSAGDSGSITFRLSVIDSTSITESNFVYEPYVGGEPSPNPDYPQEVNTVTGNSSFKITGKNLFKGTYTGYVFSFNLPNRLANSGVTINSYGDNSVNFNVNNTNQYYMVLSNVIPVNNGEAYTISFMNDSLEDSQRVFFVYSYNNGTYSLIKSFTPQIGYNEGKITVNSDYIAFAWGAYGTYGTSPIDISNIQLEEGSTATEFEPYQEHVYPISLSNIELNKIDDYQDSLYYEDGDWYLEKKIGMYTITGSEIYEWYSECPRICFNFGNIPPNNVLYPSNTTDMPYLMSNKFVTVTINDIHYVTYENRKNGFTLSNNNYISFRRKKWTDKATAVSESTGTIIYYVCRNSIKEKITDSTLLSQLNAIKNNNLFSGTNHIYFNSNIGTDISFDYIEE